MALLFFKFEIKAGKIINYIRKKHTNILNINKLLMKGDQHENCRNNV